MLRHALLFCDDHAYDDCTTHNDKGSRVGALYQGAGGAQFGVPGDFLVYVDETGHEKFADASHPVFGFGACAAPVEAVDALLFQPWAAFKRIHFREGRPLHAANLSSKKITPARCAAARAFFRDNLFFRAEAMLRSSTKLDPRLGADRAYTVAAATLAKRVVEMFKWSTSKRLVLIFESSTRLDPYADAAFRGFRVTEDGVDVPVELCRMGKGDLGLEVADFIAYAAGQKARVREGGAVSRHQLADFDSIFREVPRQYSTGMEVDTATWTPKATT